MANYLVVWFPFTLTSQYIGEYGSMDGLGGAWECVHGKEWDNTEMIEQTSQ
jgi:hypothetical protein